MKPRFFRSAAEFRQWLARHHERETELWVGFYKKASAKKGITYAEAVDQALCYGWIDGIKKRVDDEAYMHRFTPRKATSVWSVINTRRMGELTKLGLVTPPGLGAFEKRDPARSGIYSFENRPKEFPAAFARQFRANRAAWSFFEAQPPGYRRLATFWVMSAVREETRRRRLAQLTTDSERQRRLGVVTGKTGKARQ